MSELVGFNVSANTVSIGCLGDSFTGQKTQPTLLKHRRKTKINTKTQLNTQTYKKHRKSKCYGVTKRWLPQWAGSPSLKGSGTAATVPPHKGEEMAAKSSL